MGCRTIYRGESEPFPRTVFSAVGRFVRKRTGSAATVFAMAFALLPLANSTVRCDTHYVSKNGSSAPPYTSWATAADSVILAVETAEAWDTIQIGPGTYTEVSLSLKLGQTLIGAGIDSTIIVSTNASLPITYLVIGSDSSHISSIYFKGGGIDIAILYNDGRAGSISNCRFRGFAQGVRALSIGSVNPNATVEVLSSSFELCISPIWLSGGNVVVERNRVYPPVDGNAIEISSGRAIVRSNVIGGVPPSVTSAERSSFYSRASDLPAADRSILVEFCSDVTIANNLVWGGYRGIVVTSQLAASSGGLTRVIANNTACGTQAEGIQAFQAGFLVFNNIVSNAGRTGPVIVGQYSTVEFHHNLIFDFSNPPSWDPTLAHDNLFVDPMFEDTVSFRLQAYSPAIDAGDTLVFDSDGSVSDLGYYGGPLGSNYSYVDLPPRSPGGFTGQREADSIFLHWLRNSEADLNGYELIADTLEITSDDSVHRLATLGASDSQYVHRAIDPIRDYHYRLRASDNHANSSPLSTEVVFVSSGIDDGNGHEPIALGLAAPIPNPFNTQTTIKYSVRSSESSGPVQLSIYNMLGGHVNTLVNRAQGLGDYQVIWDGRDARGMPSASGLYFIVLKVQGSSLVTKALLLK